MLITYGDYHICMVKRSGRPGVFLLRLTAKAAAKSEKSLEKFFLHGRC